jgi:argininosuccinate synthase
MKQRIVLAYDGSPESSTAIATLARQHDAEVVTLTLDLGGGAALDGVRDQSLGRGATRAHVLEVQEEFAREILSVAQGDSFRPGVAVAVVARPLLARKLVDVARIEKAAQIAYMARDDEDSRLEGLIEAIEATLPVIPIHWAPTETSQRPLQRKPSLATSVAQVEIAFKDNVPLTINGIAMRLPELLESLATIAAEHGIAGGEHPFLTAATVLQAAYDALAGSHEGVVRLKITDGTCTVSEPATTR